jgi:hypothetical protein
LGIFSLFQFFKLSPCSEKRIFGHHRSSGASSAAASAATKLKESSSGSYLSMTQLCENDAIASSSAAVAEVAAQVGGVPGVIDDMYFLRHILDMKPSSDEDSLENHTSPNSPPTPQRTRSRILGHRQSMTNSNSFSHQNNQPLQPQQQNSPYSSPPISTSPNGCFPHYYHPGMKDVPLWLKTLRLHKYTTMFQDLTYDEMMNLNERQLEIFKVTKGARKKILQSLEKLRERVTTLKALEKTLDNKSDLTFIICEIRQMMNTPICSYKPGEREFLDASAIDGIDVHVDKISEQNLPGHIIHLTSKLHNILFENGNIYDLEDDYLLKLLQIYEKICSHDSFNSKQRVIAGSWKRTVRKVAVERNMLPPGNGHIGVGYAGFKRSSYTQQRMSSSTTRSSTTSPPESSCAISPPPLMMPQSYSAPPHSSSSSSTTPSISATPHLPFDKLREHPQGAALLQQLVELSLQLQKDQKVEKSNTVQSHQYGNGGGTKTPPNNNIKERISISKSLSSPDNSRLYKPLTQEEKNAFMNQCRQEGCHLTSALPPTPPNWISMEQQQQQLPTTSANRYHSRSHYGITQHSSMPSSQWPSYHHNNNNNNIHASLPPPISIEHHHQHLPSTSTTIENSRRTCYPYTGRQSLSARMPSSGSSGFSSGGSDRSSGAGSPTSSLLLPFPNNNLKWTNSPHHHHHQGSYNAEMCNNQNMPPVK